MHTYTPHSQRLKIERHLAGPGIIVILVFDFGEHATKLRP